MLIKAIIFAGEQGDLELTRTSTGAHVTQDHEVIADFIWTDSRETRYEKATDVATRLYGRDRRGRAKATNSMIHDVLNEIERVMGR